MGIFEQQRVLVNDTGDALGGQIIIQDPEPAPPPSVDRPPESPRPPTPDPVMQRAFRAAPMIAAALVPVTSAIAMSHPMLSTPATVVCVVLIAWLVMLFIPALRPLAMAPLLLVASPMLFRKLRFPLQAEYAELDAWPTVVPSQVRTFIEGRAREFESLGFQRGALLRVVGGHYAGRAGVFSSIAVCLENPATRQTAALLYSLCDPLLPPSATRVMCRHVAPDAGVIGVTNDPGGRMMRRDPINHMFALPPDASAAELVELNTAVLHEFAPGSRRQTVAERGGWAEFVRADDVRVSNESLRRGLSVRDGLGAARLATPLWITAGWRHIPLFKALRGRKDLRETRAFQRRCGLEGRSLSHG